MTIGWIPSPWHSVTPPPSPILLWKILAASFSKRGYLQNLIKMSLICMKMKLYRRNRAYALTCPVAMQINWNKRKCLHKKRVQLPQDWFGTPTWPPFHYFGTPMWLTCTLRAYSLSTLWRSTTWGSQSTTPGTPCPALCDNWVGQRPLLTM